MSDLIQAVLNSDEKPIYASFPACYVHPKSDIYSGTKFSRHLLIIVAITKSLNGFTIHRV